VAAFQKYNAFIQNLGRKQIDLDNDILKIALTNTAPNAATHSGLADITEIAAGNGYTAGGQTVDANAYSQTGGTGKLTGDDVTFVASGGAMATFRYAVLYSDTSTGDLLIAYWDRGSSLTLNDTDTFTVDFDATNGILQIT
jgi:hypothetical protein